ncbi:NAD-dependent epimerase/dehydratase family protein [Haloferax gibbonsii]|uniref:Epimerase n=1 Tax=Haloferax gibbonsii TaxID=35746 RepID=A0A0K1IYG3_HALGI|nr:NAD(P)-dependent oxidoreductase [Haloferax gibbonsii]AKU09506.1 epimerase [Haloferax gibbonsii]
MNVFIAGATGVLGKRLVDEFTEAGHDVVGLTRDDLGDRIVSNNGGRPHRGDLFDEESLVEGAADADVVIHAATAIPTETKTSAEDWKQNDRIRREGTQALTSAAAEVGAEQYIQQSVVWVARQPDGSPFNEQSSLHPDRTTQSAVDAEEIAKQASESAPFDTTVLRCGWFYSSDCEQTKTIAENVASGDMPVIGGGLLGKDDASISPIHVDDAASAFLAAVEAEANGVWHVVDDQPVTMAEFLSEFATRLNASEPSRIPGWLARFFIGKDTVRFFTNPMSTSNDKFREATGWEPQYRTYQEGLRAVVQNL